MGYPSSREVATHYSIFSTPAKSNGALHTDGITMFSYREPIAKKIGGGIVWVTSRKFSVTTSKHTNMVMGALARKNWKIQHGPDPDPVCRHCEMARSAHVDATKCLYEPTSFEEAA